MFNEEDYFLRSYVYNKIEEGNTLISKNKFESAKNSFQVAYDISKQHDETGYMKSAKQGIETCNRMLGINTELKPKK